MGVLIPSNGWPDCYQERKLSNHVAMAQLLEGVAVSYFTGAKEGVAGIITILAVEDFGYKRASVARKIERAANTTSFQRTPKTILKYY
jgi:hypothetical protein